MIRKPRTRRSAPRKSRTGLRLGLAALAVSQGWAPALAAGPWGEMAKTDLRGIHDLLAANHPGPVDPQNGFYGEWLKRGLSLADQQAERASTYSEYSAALRLYVNGFRDGHISLNFLMGPYAFSWPGFLVRRSQTDERVLVGSATEAAGVPVGAELLGCDGKSVSQMMEERLDPYRWNRDIPHARWNTLPNLFLLQTSDAALRLRTCTFRVDGQQREVPLRWSNDPGSVLNEHLNRLNPPAGQLGLRQVGDIWFVTLPSFTYSGAAAEPMKALIEELKTKAPQMRGGTIVLDVRRNGGGNSEWARQVAAAIWGDELVARVTGSFDWTVDWRVSPANIAHLESIVADNERDGLPVAAASWRQALETMKAAHGRGERLVRMPSPPRNFDGPTAVNPVTGRVFLLTDGACASSCLDFADAVRRLPNARHIGLPTSADAVYIDNTSAPLPSGLASLSYSLKVYRNRVRGNNVWYDPHVRWPGGEMTDAALVSWVETLSTAPRVKKAPPGKARGK